MSTPVVTWAVWILEVVVLVVLCVGFTYPVIAYSRNVIYRDAVLRLVLALACLGVGSVLELFVDLAVLGVLGEVAAYAAYAASSVVSVAATWRFAREFVDVDSTETATIQTDEYAGGFERDS